MEFIVSRNKKLLPFKLVKNKLNVKKKYVSAIWMFKIKLLFMYFWINKCSILSSELAIDSDWATSLSIYLSIYLPSYQCKLVEKSANVSIWK